MFYTGGRSARLRVKLPLTACPASGRDWAWHLLPIALPPTVPPEAALCSPTLRVGKGRVRVDLPFQTPIAYAPATGHVIGCGFDSGLNALLTGTVGRLAADGRVVCDGRPLAFDASGVSAKLHRLRAEREHLAAKRKRQERLLAGLTPADARFAALSAVCEVLGVEHERVCAHPQPEQGAGLVGGPLGGRSGRCRRGDGGLSGGPGHFGGARAAGTGQCAAVGAGARAGRRGDPASGGQTRPRRGHRPGPRHLPVLPPPWPRPPALPEILRQL